MIHKNEVRSDPDLVRRLLAAQFPHWADLPVMAVARLGTDHMLFRIGDELVARMPRIVWATDQAESDQRWLPFLAPQLPLAIPAPVAIGEPGEGFPWRWSIAPWLTGENPTADNFDMREGAVQLAEFIAAMGRIDTTGGPLKKGDHRGVHLAVRDEVTRNAITELGDRVDGPGLTKIWDRAVAAAPRTAPPVWLHGDLQPGNLLVRDRRFSAVIDFGAVGLGDPAVEYMPAWNLFDKPARRVFHDAAACDDETWLRAKGWALSTAVVALPYYWDTGLMIVDESKHVIEAVLDDDD